MRRSTILETIIFLTVVLFIYAATSKLLDYDLFVSQIGKSPLITGYANTIAWIIPTSEILIVLALLLNKLRLVALYASFTLMTTFTGYIVYILLFSPYVPCSCGGIFNHLGWTEHLIFNIVFISLEVIAIVLYQKEEKPTYSALTR